MPWSGLVGQSVGRPGTEWELRTTAKAGRLGPRVLKTQTKKDKKKEKKEASLEKQNTRATTPWYHFGTSTRTEPTLAQRDERLDCGG